MYAIRSYYDFKENNVGLYLENRVKSFAANGDKLDVQLESGRTIETDFVILSIGVVPDVNLAKMAGVKIGETGGIWVNEHLQTSTPDVYAVGDAIEFPHPETGKAVITYLAGPANKQGRILRNNFV